MAILNPTPIEVRFWRQVERCRGKGCWRWTGDISSTGYGRLFGGPGRRPTMMKAHRVSMELHLGRRLASTELVLHKCDNPLCVRPSHLFVGTPAQNIADMMLKGRNSRTVFAKLAPSDITLIRQMYARGLSQYALARVFNVTQPTISRAITEFTWATQETLRRRFSPILSGEK